jgi:hypothetical protein
MMAAYVLVLSSLVVAKVTDCTYYSYMAILGPVLLYGRTYTCVLVHVRLQREHSCCGARARTSIDSVRLYELVLVPGNRLRAKDRSSGAAVGHAAGLPACSCACCLPACAAFCQEW